MKNRKFYIKNKIPSHIFIHKRFRHNMNDIRRRSRKLKEEANKYRLAIMKIKKENIETFRNIPKEKIEKFVEYYNECGNNRE